MLARAFLLMALGAQAVIVGWQVYSITKDTLMLGLVGLFEAIPAISCALFAGHIVDISRPHRVYLVCVTLLAVNSFVLFLVASGVLGCSQQVVLITIFSAVFVSGILRSFNAPAVFSLFPQIVPKSEVAAASAWFSSAFQIAAISGPAIAGLLYGGYGAKIAWIMPFSLILITCILAFAISKPYHSYKSNKQKEPALVSIKAGWRFILNSKIILPVMALDMFAVLFGGAVAILPAFADQVLHVGSEGLGMLRASPAIGAVVTAIFLALKPFKEIKGRTLLVVVAGFGATMIGFALSSSFYMAALMLMLSGMFDSVSMVIRATMLQLLTPEDMRGRVSSVNNMFIISSNEIGAFESGLAAKIMGLVPSIIFGGCATLLVVVTTSIASKDLVKLKLKAQT